MDHRLKNLFLAAFVFIQWQYSHKIPSIFILALTIKECQNYISGDKSCQASDFDSGLFPSEYTQISLRLYVFINKGPKPESTKFRHSFSS